jgi:hypothetical protein
MQARGNLPNQRLNGGDILGGVVTVAVEHPSSEFRAISTDEDVTTDFGAWIVVSARRIAGGQRRGWSGGHSAPGAGCPPRWRPCSEQRSGDDALV